MHIECRPDWVCGNSRVLAETEDFHRLQLKQSGLHHVVDKSMMFFRWLSDGVSYELSGVTA